MSNSDTCSNDKVYGGLGAMIYNNLRRGEEERTCCREKERATSAWHAVAAASATPAPAKATVAPLRASGTKKSPPVAVAARTRHREWAWKWDVRWKGWGRCNVIPCFHRAIIRDERPLGIFNSYVSVIQNKIVFGTLVRISNLTNLAVASWDVSCFLSPGLYGSWGCSPHFQQTLPVRKWCPPDQFPLK